MPRQQTILTIVLASPSDVGDECEIAAEVIREFNGTWSHELGITLELASWRTDVHPAAGADPQQVINDQLPNPHYSVRHESAEDQWMKDPPE
jgi:hypothetical protein